MKRALLVTLVTVALASSARADRRAFTQTYEYQTQPRGNLELEYYNTQETAELDTDSATAIEHKIEIEYGITDHWDVSLYQIWAGGEDGAGQSGYGYDSTALRTRYRFAERGEWPVDLLLYGEVTKPFGVQGVAVEGKVIVARDLGPVTLVLNLVAELEPEEEKDAVSGETEVEYEMEYETTFGATFELSPEWKLGGEIWGNPEAFEDGGEGGMWAGPALAWAPSTRLWLAATAGFRVAGEDTEPEGVARFIVGLGL